MYETEHGNCGYRYKKSVHQRLKNNEDGFILTESTSMETTLDDNDDGNNTHNIFS